MRGGRSVGIRVAPLPIEHFVEFSNKNAGFMHFYFPKTTGTCGQKPGPGDYRCKSTEELKFSRGSTPQPPSTRTPVLVNRTTGNSASTVRQQDSVRFKTTFVGGMCSVVSPQ